MKIIQKIREDWGTGAHFCRKHGLNYQSFKTVLAGAQKSQKCVDALLEHGYINSASDLPQYREAP